MSRKKNLLMAVFFTLGLSGLMAGLIRVDLDSAAGTSGKDLPESAETTVAHLNEQFQFAYAAQNLTPAPFADNLTIARRLSLGLMGTIPSLEEIRLMESIPKESQIAWWTDRILEDRRCSDYLAERFARAFVGTEDGPFLVYRRRRFVMWLSDQFQQNRSYDAIVRDLISDTGLWTDSPAVNFLTVTNDVNGDDQPDEERLAARTTRAFLGVRLDCVQCHDDNLNGKWVQQDFHQLSAFFCEAESSPLGIRDKEGKEYRYTYLHANEEVTVPQQVPFAQDLLEEVATGSSATQRQVLANWVTHPRNLPFARTLVNRVWALMFGKPLIEPIDSIPLDGPYPPGLELLANDFLEHEFDVHRLIRIISQSEVFQRDSRSELPSVEAEAAWAIFPLTRLRPEQVSGGIIQSSSLKTIDADSHILVTLIRLGERNEFVRRYGDSGEDEFTGRAGTIPQRLLMMNGKLVKERTKDDLIFNASTRIANLCKDDVRCIETAYLTTLTRRPSTSESNHFVAKLRAQDRSRKAILEDIFWALINSSEFSWSH